MLRRWVNQPGTALSEAVHGHVVWTQESHLLAALVDAVQIGNWQRVGKKHLPRPKPLPRPGDKRKNRLGFDPIPIDQFDDWWESKSKKK